LSDVWAAAVVDKNRLLARRITIVPDTPSELALPVMPTDWTFVVTW
jgi:hypothetical protein